MSAVAQRLEDACKEGIDIIPSVSSDILSEIVISLTNVVKKY